MELVPAMLGGESVMPAYTAPERILQATGNTQPFAKLPTLEILRKLPANTKLVINPGARDGCAFRPDEIAALLLEADPPPMVMPKGSEVRLGHSAQSLEWLTDALSDRLTQLSAVQAAHVALIEMPAAGEPPHPIVGLQIADGTDIDSVMRPLKVAVDEASRGPVDFVPIGNDVISVWLLENTEPFFRRPLS